MSRPEGETARFAKAIGVPEIQITDALKMVQGNKVLQKVINLLFTEAMAAHRNTLETVKLEDLQVTQGKIAGLKQGLGIIQGQEQA